MKVECLFQNDHVAWYVFGRDLEKPEKIIDTNQYMVIAKGKALLLDPGGVELFSPMLSSVLKYVGLDDIEALFASHQDPDIISSLGLWDQCLSNAKLYSPWLWEGFIRHFGMNNIEYVAIPDEGTSVTLGGHHQLRFIPAHYLHSSGNAHVYDPVAKVLMSGDVGAAMEEPDSPLIVEDFDAQIKKMEYFHRRWMPSNQAKNHWIKKVRKLDIDIMAPQHGAIFTGDNISRFLDWFEALDVGCAIADSSEMTV